jgi:hypothetical protein
MSTKEEFRHHSRDSSNTHVPDLENGEARPDKEEEVVEQNVRTRKSCIL